MTSPEVTSAIKLSELKTLIDRVANGKLSEADLALVGQLLRLLFVLLQKLDDTKATVANLKRLIFGPKSEKRNRAEAETRASTKPSAVPDPAAEKTGADNPPLPENPASASMPAGARVRKAGHGRLGVSDYPGAKIVNCRHLLKPGDQCPAELCKGHLYNTNDPQIFIQRDSRPIIEATKYSREVLRCSACQERFVAQLPEGVKAEKFTTSADVMIAILKYGASMPFYRLAQLQALMGVPLPASTQFERCEAVANAVHPIYLELVRQAAQGDLLHTDDTSVKILSCLKENKQLAEGERKGQFTTGIGARSAKFDILLYFSGRRYSGENLEAVLRQRAAELADPLVMGDAERKNWVSEFKKIVCKCLVHGRRKFVACEKAFPGECEHVLEELAKVYELDAQTRQMTPVERLQFHQAYSQPIMDDLKVWLAEQLRQKIVEPASSLGKAMKYMLRHWFGLTQFLRLSGAPLDNNYIERALRRAVINRKNWLFYKTEHGAAVGDILTSILSTCAANQVNPFDYLVAVVNNARAARREPTQWLPWNYKLPIAA